MKTDFDKWKDEDDSEDEGRSEKDMQLEEVLTVEETVSICVIICPRPFFPTLILKLLTLNQTNIWHERIRSKVIRCTFLGHNSI